MDVGNVVAMLEMFSDRDRLLVACCAVKMICRDFSKTGKPCNYCPVGGWSRCKQIHEIAELLKEELENESEESNEEMESDNNDR
jgi:Na+-translocating ferredoxin:NAD+ oxidoreductase RNF subunit RnfB